ncbi:sialidase family protein [Caballeronia sp. DA-9]|uniref:sialidase family protein n=1 Tax=Caballeronia sp. DA-9 TaxID=3436237 RepID=UPI003F672DAD
MLIAGIRFRILFTIGLALTLALSLTNRAPAQTMPGMSGMSGMHHMASSPCDSTQALGCADTATAAFLPNGTLLLAWTQDQKVYFARSKDQGENWTLPLRVGDLSASFDGGGDARPQLVADASGHVLIAYDTFRDKHWNAQIWLARSADGGAHFDAPSVFEPGSVSQRLPVLDATPSGRILMLWQDKRLSGPRQLPGASIAYAWSTDGGQTFSTSTLASTTSCECCRIGVTNSVDGTPVTAFRTIFPGSVRDHVIVHFGASGEPGKQQRVSVDNWVTDACPHQGPSVAISGNGSLHVVWYTQGTARQGLFYARSSDGGANFDTPQRLGTPDDVASRAFVLAHASDVWRVWKDFDGHVSHVLLQTSRNDGRDWSVPSIIDSSTGRSDHPLLVGYRDRVFLSWLSSEHGYQLVELKAL